MISELFLPFELSWYLFLSGIEILRITLRAPTSPTTYFEEKVGRNLLQQVRTIQHAGYRYLSTLKCDPEGSHSITQGCQMTRHEDGSCR